MKELIIKERRLERLRNLMSPSFNLPLFIQENENGKLDDLIKSTADKAAKSLPLIKEALRSDITLLELGQLYVDPENRRPNLNGLTIDCAKDLVRAIEVELNTKEKQVKFLSEEFPKILPNIDFEGSADVVAYSIFVEFGNNNMLGSLISTMNSVLKTALYFKIDKEKFEA